MKWPRALTRRRLLRITAGSLGLLGLYTWRVEPRWLEVVVRKLPIRNLPTELVGASLVQMSDLHISPRVDDAYLSRVFQLVRDLSPEIVVYTGDFVSYHTDLREHAPRLISQLALGSLGTFGILGNHDYGYSRKNLESANRIASLAENAGVRMLRNETAEVRGLKIAGMEELWSDRFDLESVIPGLTESDASLVLAHNPDAADEVGWGDYSGWILAGHTHGGQCKPPFLPPPFLPVRNRRYTSGEFDLSNGRRMYINRGVGHLMRVRCNSRPEVTVFELVRE